jgi:hypothetical protein
MLLNGNSEDINRKAVGGYYSKAHKLLFKHSDNTVICAPGLSIGGKKKIIKTKKQKNKNNKRKKFTKRKKIKFSKTSKYNKNIYM